MIEATNAADKPDRISLAGEVVIVTGAGRGLGRAYALELARRGASVVVNDLGEGADGGRKWADEVAGLIRDAGGAATASYDSVATAEGGQAIVDEAVRAFGTVDAVVNNAGFLRNGSFGEIAPDDLRSVIDVHLCGAFHVTQPAWRLMREKGYGRVVLTGSSAGAFGREAGANYCAAKAGLIGLGNALALEGAPYGIATNVLMPYGATSIQARTPLPPEYLARARGLIEAAAGGREIPDRNQPERVAPLVAYLVSRQCRLNGEAVSACAGRYARVFVGATPGWLSPGDAIPPAEEIRDHLGEIQDPAGYRVFSSLFDEVADVTGMLARRSSAPAAAASEPR